MAGLGKAVLKRKSTSNDDEEYPTGEGVSKRRVSYSGLNQDEEDEESEDEDYEEKEEDNEDISSEGEDSFREENIGSTSHGMLSLA